MNRDKPPAPPRFRPPAPPQGGATTQIPAPLHAGLFHLLRRKAAPRWKGRKDRKGSGGNDSPMNRDKPPAPPRFRPPAPPQGGATTQIPAPMRLFSVRPDRALRKEMHGISGFCGSGGSPSPLRLRGTGRLQYLLTVPGHFDENPSCVLSAEKFRPSPGRETAGKAATRGKATSPAATTLPAPCHEQLQALCGHALLSRPRFHPSPCRPGSFPRLCSPAHGHGISRTLQVGTYPPADRARHEGRRAHGHG